MPTPTIGQTFRSFFIFHIPHVQISPVQEWISLPFLYRYSMPYGNILGIENYLQEPGSDHTSWLSCRKHWRPLPELLGKYRKFPEVSQLQSPAWSVHHKEYYGLFRKHSYHWSGQ